MAGTAAARNGIHRWQQRSPQLVEKPTLHESSDPVSWWKCQLLLRCVEGRVPRTSMLNLPFCCRHVEPSNERVQDKCQTSHHIKWFKAISNVVAVQPCRNTLENFATRRKHTQGKTNAIKLIPGPARWFLVDPSGLLDSLKLEQQSFHSLTARLEGCSSIFAH